MKFQFSCNSIFVSFYYIHNSTIKSSFMQIIPREVDDLEEISYVNLSGLWPVV